jgi:hypothetical protein
LSIGFDLGFVLLDLRRYALSALRYALFRKVVFPDLFHPIDHFSEFVEEGHLVEVILKGMSGGDLHKSSAGLSQGWSKLITPKRLCQLLIKRQT